MSKLKDLVGLKFGRLKVLHRVEIQHKSKPIWNCICDCGNTTTVYGFNLTRDLTKSCGCLAKEIASDRLKTHGLRSHRLYDTWNKMVRRCNNPLDSGWNDYGARGISVTNEWMDVTTFISDMESSYKEGYTLERLDVNGNYCKENCIWLVKSLQAKNKRMYKTNSVGLSGVNIIFNKGIETVQARFQSSHKRYKKTWSLVKYTKEAALELAREWLTMKYKEFNFGITHGINNETQT